jgi:hypothetical protein
MVVVEASMPNLFLGEPDLLRTGFNAKRHLRSARERYHMADFSTANTALTSALAADSPTPIMGSLSASFALMNADVVDEWDDMPELASSESDLSASDQGSVDEVSEMIAHLNTLRENPSPLIYGNIADADPLAEYHDVDVGVDNQDDVNDAVQDMIQPALDTNILSAAGEAR